MAQWQFLLDGVPTEHDHFIDTQTVGPGEEGFNTDEVQAKLEELRPAANGFNYMGPTPRPAPEE